MYAIAGDGCKIWYDGGSQAVLLIHGFASDSRHNWTAPGWGRVFPGAVVADLRGHGQSDRPRAGFTPEQLAADMAAVLDAAGLTTVDVVTYSMGGIVGWELARAGRVRRLVIGGLGGGTASRADFERVLEALPGNDDLQPCIDGMAGRRLAGEPPVPVLFAAGDADELAGDAAAFAESLGAPFVSLGKRNHFNAISSRVFKQAALEAFGS
ncbi:alpha/beta hydrolase [Amycolatopsis acidicola]|uniref:Alpha/beta hydrolase n=1 Tax=Amycolatopsis acidicola TaxID=2596893 RepID=A0A5N0US04_9PSEU|nr:alpha/beta hydrolase [Amycolatopsis acidicola]KAA9154210.1 alpha/beta hydrolase [Amycolatopsis acidicola]